jgi:hypothetical protein
VPPRDRGEELARIGVLRVAEQRRGRAVIDDAAPMHHGQSVADLRRNPQIVGDEQHRQAEALADLGEQPKDLRLNRDVEGRDRLVCDQHLGLGSDVAGLWPHVLNGAQEQALKPGDSFRECRKDCPEMVVVPAGSFAMGSPETEKDRHTNEGPQHEVTIAKQFAVYRALVDPREWTCGFISRADVADFLVKQNRGRRLSAQDAGSHQLTRTSWATAVAEFLIADADVQLGIFRSMNKFVN